MKLYVIRLRASFDAWPIGVFASLEDARLAVAGLSYSEDCEITSFDIGVIDKGGGNEETK